MTASASSLPLSPVLKSALIERATKLLSTKRLFDYRPYPKQAEFHRAGAHYRERLLRAGNQLGKTWAGGAETAYHLTGRYPDWWDGRRFDRAVVGWAGGPGGEAVRDNVQRILMGRPGDLGTGMVPGADIIDTSSARGIADLIDTVRVRHISGAASTLKFKSYDQGRERWQGETLDFIWLDEEPPLDIYTEALTRTNATGGFVFLTFTPLLGMSDVVARFLLERAPDRHDTNLTIDDAPHIPEDKRQQIIASYPVWEREARTRGIPSMGSGRAFPVARSQIECDAFIPPDWWASLGGIDFGWDHPTAGVKLVHDRDNDIIYVTNCYRVREQPAVIHAAALKQWGPDLFWAWPDDALQHDKGSGDQLAHIYRQNGLKFLDEPARFDDDRGRGVEAGVADMLDRMLTGRWKVFRHLNEWFEEFELYHRVEGKLVKERDDLLSASRYGMMMIRHARSKAERPIIDRYSRRSRRGNGSWMTA